MFHVKHRKVNIMIKLLKFIFYKWTSKSTRCPHFCFICEYRKKHFKECIEDIIRYNKKKG